MEDFDVWSTRVLHEIDQTMKIYSLRNADVFAPFARFITECSGEYSLYYDVTAPNLDIRESYILDDGSDLSSLVNYIKCSAYRLHYSRYEVLDLLIEEWMETDIYTDESYQALSMMAVTATMVSAQ